MQIMATPNIKQGGQMKHLYEIHLLTQNVSDSKRFAFCLPFFGTQRQADKLFRSCSYSLNCSGFVGARLFIKLNSKYMEINSVDFKANATFNKVIGD